MATYNQYARTSFGRNGMALGHLGCMTFRGHIIRGFAHEVTTIGYCVCVLKVRN